MQKKFANTFILASCRGVFVTSLLLILASCATEPKEAITKSSSQDIDYALSNAMNCVKLAIPQFDDGVSSAETVGNAAMGSCNSEVNIYTETALRGTTLNASEYPEMSEKIRTIFSNVTVQLVLKRRVKGAGS